MNVGHSSNETKGTFFLSCEHGHDVGDRHWIRVGREKYPVYKLGGINSGPVDLALFFLRGRELEPCYKIPEESPNIGEKAWMVGYPFNLSTFRETHGVIETTKTQGYEYQFSRASISGESGGPLFVRGFNLVGVVSARNRGSTLVTTLPQIRSFLEKTIGAVPQCRKTVVPAADTSPKSLDELLSRRVKFLELQVKLGRTEFNKLGEMISALKEEIARLKEIQPLKGDKGDPGADGETRHVFEKTGRIVLEIVNSRGTWTTTAKYANGVYTITLPNQVVQTTKADGKTPTDEKSFPFGTPIRLKSEIPIAALKRALEKN